MALVVRCRGRRTELGLRSEGSSRTSRGGEIPVAHQVNDQPMVKLRWTASADGKTASYREDAVALLQSFSDGGQLKIMVPDGSGRDKRGDVPTRRMERDPRQDRDGLHVGVDGEQFIAAALELKIGECLSVLFFRSVFGGILPCVDTFASGPWCPLFVCR